MGYYVRMLSRGKWEVIEDFQLAPADTLQSELKTTKNTLSLWYIKDLSEKNEAVIALASARNKIDRLDILCIEEELLKDFSIKCSPETGLSPYEEFNKNHYDIQEVDYATLGEISKIILSKIKETERLAIGNVSTLLIEAFGAGKLNKSTMEESLQMKIQQKLIS